VKKVIREIKVIEETGGKQVVAIFVIKVIGVIKVIRVKKVIKEIKVIEEIDLLKKKLKLE